MSLLAPHPLWLTARSSSYEVIKATAQAKMLSERYRTEKLCSHWSNNKPGYCLSCCSSQVEDLSHILLDCPSLSKTRNTLTKFTQQYSTNLPETSQQTILQICTPTHPLFMQFLLDCSVIPCAISLVQNFGSELLHHLFHCRVLGAILFTEKGWNSLEDGDIPKVFVNIPEPCAQCRFVRNP